MANNSVKRARRELKNQKQRISRPKTFRTEESAKKYADENKIKKYKLEDLKSNSKSKKIRIIAEK